MASNWWVTSFFKEVLIQLTSIRNCFIVHQEYHLFSWDDIVYCITKKFLSLSRFGRVSSLKSFFWQTIFKDMSLSKKNRISLHICAKITIEFFVQSLLHFYKWQNLDVSLICAIYVESCLAGHPQCFIIYCYSFSYIIGIS